MRAPFHLAAAAAAALVLAGCSDGALPPPQSGGQIGGEPAGCFPVEGKSLDLALDERSPSGFSADEALANIAATWTRTFTWAKGGETEVIVSVEFTGGSTVKWHDREWQGPEAEAMAAELGECLDAIELPVAIGFTTMDGAFDESWEGKVEATSASEGSHYHRLDLAALHGSYEVTEVDPAQYDDVSVDVDMFFEDAWVLGDVQGTASHTQTGDGADSSTADGSSFDVGTF